MFYKTLIGKNVWLIKSFFIIGIVLLSACKTGVIVKETYQIPAEMGKIIILPFQDMSEVYGENVNVRCPLLDNVFMTGKVAKGAVDMLTDHSFRCRCCDCGIHLPFQGKGRDWIFRRFTGLCRF
jgi:hypothetical protein